MPTSQASDIYALGVILHEMIGAGRPLDARWARAINRCLALAPQDRPQDAMQIVHALETRLTRSTLIAFALALLVLLGGVSWVLRTQSVDPQAAAAHLAAGRSHETAGQYEKAREDYQRAVDADPRNLEAYLRIADIYSTLDMAERAVAAYRQAIALEPRNYKPHHALGVFYYYRGQYREAIEQFRQSIERAPQRVDEYTNLAATFSDLGEDAKAEQVLRESLQIQETANAWNSLGAIRAYQKNDAEAIAHYRRAVALDAADFVFWLNLGDSARRLQLTTEASSAYEKALRLARDELAQNPRLGLTRAYVSYFLARLGQSALAEDYIREALKFSPGDSKVVRRAVLTYEALGKRGDAIAVLGAAGPDMLHELGRHPDLADFSRDARFRPLLIKPSTTGGH
jgi:tetratricopeptide (TPR) repeat protein